MLYLPEANRVPWEKKYDRQKQGRCYYILNDYEAWL